MKMRLGFAIAVLGMLAFAARAAVADSMTVIYNSDGLTISASDPFIISGDGDPWAINYTLDQTHNWDQMAVQVATGDNFASPELSGFSPDSFSVAVALPSVAWTNEIGTSLVNVSESFTVTFAGSAPSAGSINVYTFYDGGYGERDFILDISSAGVSSFGGLFASETPPGGESNNGSNQPVDGVAPGGYIGSEPLSSLIAPLPATSSSLLVLLGIAGVMAKFRILRPV
jgi:hypothetical protein